MTNGDLVPPGLTEAGKAFVQASGPQTWVKARLRWCGWCKEPLGDLQQGQSSFCDEGCQDLWMRRQDLDVPLPRDPLPYSVGNTVPRQRVRQEEFEEADEIEGVEFITRLDELAFERMMRVPYWVFIWPDGAVSLVSAESREEAVDALEEVGKRAPEDIRPVADHMLDGYIHDQEVDLARHRVKLKVERKEESW